jgi:phage terminase small subunit
MAENKAPAAPPGLEGPGRKLWKDVLADYELSPAEMSVLEVACRALDRMRAAEKVLAAEGLTVSGRWGPQPHPLILVARDAGTQLRAAIKQLKVELDADDGRINRPGPRPSTRIKERKSAIAARRASQWGAGA